MARVTDALLGNQAYGRGSSQPMLDPKFGGQMGYSPVLTEWVSNQAYVPRNVIPILLEAPRFFQLMPDPQKWIDTLKAIMEKHVRTIEGLNAGITFETDEHPVGGAGEMQQEITDAKRARTEPVMTFVDLYGMPIQSFMYQWMTYGGMDPDTKFALMNTLAGDRPTDMLADQYSASMMFIEPDPSHRSVVKSWTTVNMFPLETGDIVGKRDLTTAMAISTPSIRFAGISQFNLGSNIVAQRILDSINMVNANPYLRPGVIQDISSDVKASEKGYIEGITTLASSAVPGLR
jgi:hypothetical protein